MSDIKIEKDIPMPPIRMGRYSNLYPFAQMLTPRQFRRLLAAGRKYRRPAVETRLQRRAALEFIPVPRHKWRELWDGCDSGGREIARLRRLLAATRQQADDSALYAGCLEDVMDEAGLRMACVDFDGRKDKR